MVRKDGSTVWLEAAVSDIRDSEGQLVGFQGACRDITERKRAEEELQKAHAELEARVEQRTAELKEANVLLIAGDSPAPAGPGEAAGERVQVPRTGGERQQHHPGTGYQGARSPSSTALPRSSSGSLSQTSVGRHVVGTIAPPIDSEGKDRKAQTRDLVKHPENYLVIENEGVRRNGERVWISWTNKGLYDTKGTAPQYPLHRNGQNGAEAGGRDAGSSS